MISKFSEHPKTVGETYWQHLIYATNKAWCIFTVSAIIFIHGIFPFLYEHEGSERIEKLCHELTQRKEGNINEEDCRDHRCCE